MPPQRSPEVLLLSANRCKSRTVPLSRVLYSQPYDEEYLKEKDIKHMSFHSYCRKLLSGHGKGTVVIEDF